MPLRKFELLSLVGRKKHPEEAAAPPPSGTTSSISSRPPYPSSSGSSSSGYSGFHRSSAPLPPPAPPSVPVRDGFYSAVQYERLTPSVTQRPPVLGGASSAPSSSSGFPSSSSVQYERLVPPPSSSSRLPSPQYERLTPSSATLPSPPVQYERLTPTTSPAGGATLMGGRSPMQFRQPSPGHGGMSPSPAIPPLHSARSASFPGGSTLPSPPVNLRSPVDLASGGAVPPPARADSLRRDRLGSSSARALPPVAENDVVMEGTPSDKSTPFSMVMEEWMSQLRTPTPDVMLLPSPFDFNRGTPTPVEKMEDIRHIHEALLPTPPPLASESPNDLRQGTKTTEYVTSSNSRRPLVEDIASLCRDLISQEVSQQLAIRLKKMGAFPPNSMPPTNSEKVPRVPAMARTESTAAADEDDDDDESQFDDSTSVGGSAAGGNGSAKGKRRKMCTAEGCQNLSRSRGLCKAHGGGRRCSVDGCSRASQSGSLCITHGGGKRCTVDGCMKAAQSRGMCKAHGGGVRCRVEGCTKSSQGDGFCRTHGGGRRCGYEGGCQKWAQRNGMCMAHSEGRYGNSYRGRVARSAGADAEQQLAAQTLVGAAKASVY